MTYEEWMAEADAVCIGIAGVGIEDLADGPSRDAFDDELTPREYVMDRLRQEGF